MNEASGGQRPKSLKFLLLRSFGGMNMSRNRIHDWNDIANDYRRGGLILGNGASRAFDDERFCYSSILAEARRLGHITSTLERVFRLLGTSDFEHVLRRLWQANYINHALGVGNQSIARAYRNVQQALVETVRHIHENVTYSSMVEAFYRAADFLSQFGIVLSLNYDVLVYWGMTKGMERLHNHFADCWVNREFQYDWKNFQSRYETLVFYPHGNLIFGRDIDGIEYKIHAGDMNNLLNTIIQAWISEDLVPVFVSEGNSEQKKKTIGRSPYLSTVYNQVIPNIGDKIVIYGWTMSEVYDNHLIEAIKNSNANRFAISVHLSSGRHEEDCARIRRILIGHEVVFFNSASEGCWIYPATS